jgi:threonine/homoserine/homoserine lactone efflux protein
MSRSIAAGVPGPLLAATIHWGSVGPLLVTALAIMGSPGPATISLTAAGSAHGVRRSLGYLAGIVAGTVVVLVSVATGITATLLAVPALRSVLIVLSAAYTDAAAKVALLTMVAVLIMTVWLVVGAFFAPSLRNPRRARVVNLALAAALVAATALALR